MMLNVLSFLLFLMFFSSSLASDVFHEIFRNKNNAWQFTDCSLVDYEGKANRTKDGVPCLKWSEAYSANARIRNLTRLLTPHDLKTSFCRNRDHDPLGPWCFSADSPSSSSSSVSYCDLGADCHPHRLKCKRSRLGLEYRGDKNVTLSGRPCAAWKGRMAGLDASIAFADNRCRNPDGDLGGPWCYVDEEGVTGADWESCGVEWCPGFRIVIDAHGSTVPGAAWEMTTFDAPKRIVRFELKAGIGRGSDPLLRPRNIAIAGSNSPNCDRDFIVVQTVAGNAFKSQMEKQFVHISEPGHFVCYNVSVEGVHNPEAADPHTRLFRDLVLWENLAEMDETHLIDEALLRKADSILTTRRQLPQSVVIDFGNPTYVTHYSFKPNRNVSYRLEGSLRKDCNNASNDWMLLDRRQKSTTFTPFETRSHSISHNPRSFNCFRLTFESDPAVPRYQDFLTIKDLRLNQSVGEVLANEICGRRVVQQDVFNDPASGRILGGVSCQRGACPWQASLMSPDAVSFCGGSVIDDRHVLTAAHCFYRNGVKMSDDKVRQTMVVLGKTDLTAAQDSAQTHVIEDFALHPHFDVDKFVNDVAVLRLRDKILFNAHVIPICLPASDGADSNITDAWVSGWGIRDVVDDHFVMPNELQVAVIETTSTAECAERWKKFYQKDDDDRWQCADDTDDDDDDLTKGFLFDGIFDEEKRICKKIDENVICAGGHLIDTCNGDSGGPLAAFDNGQRFVQVGIVSWGVAWSHCGKVGMPPGVYTRVSSHLHWIREFIETKKRDPQLNVCKKFEFQCSNGWCLSSERVCNGIEDCKDGLDEAGCHDPLHICGEPAWRLPPSKAKFDPILDDPWMAVVFEKGWEPRCPGIIIDELFVLTSGRCFYPSEKPSNFFVQTGNSSRMDEPSRRLGSVLGIERISHFNGFSLLRLKSAIKFSGRRRPICLSSFESSDRYDRRAVGWIRVKRRPLSLVLMNDTVCSERNRRFVGNICGEPIGISRHPGAYGRGNAIVAYKNSRAYLYGIVNSEEHKTGRVFSYTKLTAEVTDMIASKMINITPTRCPEGLFQCPSGVCLDMARLCNGFDDCKGGADELECTPWPNACLSVMCFNGGKCQMSPDGLPTCICPLGYAGDRCQVDIDDCVNVTCHYRAKCRDGVNGSTCICPPGTEGRFCERDRNECASNPCRNGRCIDGFDSFHCDCTNSTFKGKFCEIELTTCEFLSPCKNWGVCRDLPTRNYTCACRDGYVGENCEIDVDECASNPCLNGATCRNEIGKFLCDCRLGFNGTKCETEINECETEKVICHKGHCVDEVGKFSCNCSKGFTGKYCAKEIEYCEFVSCYHGYCQDRPILRPSDKGYSCSCDRAAREKYDQSTDCKVHPMTGKQDLEGPAGGVLFAITETGLDNIVEYFRRKFVKEMETFKFDKMDNIRGRESIFDVNEEYEISFDDIAIVPSSFDVDPPRVRLTNREGLAVEVVASCTIIGKWQLILRSDGLEDFRDDGRIELRLERFTVKLNFRIGEDETTECDIIVGSLDAEIKDSMFDFVYQFFIDIFKKKIKEEIPKASCGTISKRFDKLSNIFSQLPSGFNFSMKNENGQISNFSVDLTPSKRYITRDAIVHNLVGELRSVRDSLKTYAGVPPSPFPRIRQDFDVVVVINEYCINRVLHVLQQEGFADGRLHLDDDSGPLQAISVVCEQLDICSGEEDCCKSLSNPSIRWTLLSPPEIIIKRGGIKLKIPKVSLVVTVFVGNEGRNVTVLDNDLLVAADVRIQVNRERAHSGNALTNIWASIDIQRPRVLTLATRLATPTGSDEEIWTSFISVLITDWLRPSLTKFAENQLDILNNMKENFHLDQIAMDMRIANDVDGVTLKDMEIRAVEGSLYVGVDVERKS